MTNGGLENIWSLIALVSVGVFFIRFSFFWIMDKITITPGMRRVLAYIPAAVLPAIVVPAVVFKGATPGLQPDNLRLWATAVAILVAWKTENLFATIGAGLGTLWLLNFLVM